MKALRYVPVLLLPLVVASCKSTKDASPYEDPYVANFGNDGGYNPYPDSGGYAAAPTYDSPPVDEYAFTAPSKPAASTTTSRPSSSSTASKPAPKPTPKPAPKPVAKPKPKVTPSKTHTVAKGETLYGLARKYNSTVAKIKAANGLSGDLIRIGQKLKIP
jgi:hypothetical protein